MGPGNRGAESLASEVQASRQGRSAGRVEPAVDARREARQDGRVAADGSDRAVGFRPTRWSLVARATGVDRAVASRALGELCEIYWVPLYAWLRRSGRPHGLALDLVQSFCAELLDRGGLDGADAERGSFRAYLLGALRNFVANEARRERAQKRGGDRVAWSFGGIEAMDDTIAANERTPEEEFERTWAQALLDRASGRLRDEYAARSRLDLLDALQPALLGDAATESHAATALRLGTSEGAIKVALHRLRGRLRELIREEVLHTVDDPSRVDDEIRSLMTAFAGPGSAVRRSL